MYYVRAYVTNTAGTTYGTEVSFTTDPEAPTVTTQDVSSIGMTTATGNGNVTDLGAPNPTQHGICWSTSENPTIAGDKTTEGVVSATGAFTSSITGLSPNTMYYVRAYATNTADISYGNQVSFTSAPAPATVTTQAVNPVGQTTATGNGNVTDLGDPNPHQHGVCWNMGGTPTLADSKTEDGAASVIGAFTSSITGLNPNTMYYVRAYATNTAGTSYGIQVYCTTLAEAPVVATNAVTEMTTTSATLNGTVNARNASTTVTFEYGLTDSYGTNVTADESPVTGIVDTQVSYALTGLTANTTYHYRVVGVNDGGTSTGADLTFVTTPEPSIITTQAVTNIGINIATGNGNITDLGIPNPTAHGMCWNTTGTPTLSDNYSDEGVTSSTGAFTSGITGLDANTSYHVRAYATNSAGTAYGEEVSFSTLPNPPSASTVAATDVTAFSAILNGTINAHDGSSTVTFEYGLDDSYGTTVTADESPVTGSSDEQVSYQLTDLTANTTYHYRVVGVNDGGTVNGSDLTFTTLSQAPIANSTAASDLEPNAATLNGTVNANDLSTAVTFEYGLTDSYGTTVTAEESPVTGTSDTEVSAPISGLDPNKTYHYRVVGQNSEATTNGVDIAFTTTKYDQVITFAVLSEKTTDDADFDAGATSDLGLIISYASSNELAATIVSDLIHIVGAGTTEITASQEGNDTVNAATPVVQNLIVTQGTGLDNSDIARFKMFPNPAGDLLSIDIGRRYLSGNVNISIIDLNGKIVFCDNFDETICKIDVSDFSSGLYFIEISTSEGIKKLKLIIE